MPGKKILVVDDNEVTGKLLSSLLEQNGYEVKVVAEGLQTIMEGRRFSPSLVLMDIVLPDLEGPEVVKMMQKDEMLRDVPVVFLSGILEVDKSKDMIVNNKKYTALSKSATASDLLKAIKQNLSQKK